MINTEQYRESGGWSRELDLCLLEVTGPDSRRYLQSQTTNDLNLLPPGRGQLSCLLDRKAKVLSAFHIFCLEDSFQILLDSCLKEKTLEHLQKFRFADRVEFAEVSGSIVLVEGKRSRSVLSKLIAERLRTDGPPAHLFDSDITGVADLKLFKISMTGEEGFLIWSGDSITDDINAAIEKIGSRSGLEQLSKGVLEIARIEGGTLKFGVDYDEDNLLSETPMDENAVSYSKGCFQGQEVLARVRSHGAPSRALVGLSIEPAGEHPFRVGSEIIVDAQAAGWIKSNTNSKFLGRHIAIALMKRDFRTPGRSFEATINGVIVRIEVETLPFFEALPAGEEARRLYDSALQVFASEAQDTDAEQAQSVALLRQAIMLDPLFENAYESLGVILSKYSRLDEAIELMQHLAAINPDSVMAHTNLSVFYLEKGWKEKAEDEKAISMSIRMRMAAKEATRQQREKEEREQQDAETRERMEMFEQVLEIDADDLLANYGMGSCLVELGSHEEAVPYLEKAIAVKPTHSVAYLSLGRAFKQLGEKDRASRVLNQGIEVSSRRGDMEPMRKMQELLSELDPSELIS